MDPESVPRITARETAARLDLGEPVVVVDVRRPVAHARVHITGDHPYPAREYAQRKGELPRDKLLVLY